MSKVIDSGMDIYELSTAQKKRIDYLGKQNKLLLEAVELFVDDMDQPLVIIRLETEKKAREVLKQVKELRS